MLLRGESVAFLWPTKFRVRSCSGIYRNGCGFPPSLDPHFHRALTRCNVLPEHCSSGRLNAACGSTPHGKLGRFEMEINTQECLRLYCPVYDFIEPDQPVDALSPDHSTVTLFARFRGLSTSVPRAHAV